MLKAGISSGKLYLSAGTVRADNQCQFGKRLYASEIPAAQFALAGRREAAEREMGPEGIRPDFARINRGPHAVEYGRSIVNLEELCPLR